MVFHSNFDIGRGYPSASTACELLEAASAAGKDSADVAGPRCVSCGWQALKILQMRISWDLMRFYGT